jgi:hypothetical protein
MIIQEKEKDLIKQLKNNILNNTTVFKYSYKTHTNHSIIFKNSMSLNILNKKNLLVYSGYLLNSNGYFIKIFKKAGIKNIILDIHEYTSEKNIKNILGKNYNKDCYIIKPYKSSNNSKMCIVIIDLNKIKL